MSANVVLTISACALLLLLRPSPATANYKLEHLGELKCLNPAPSPTSTLDPQWMMSVGTWYYVHMSQLDVYQTMADVTGVGIHDVKDEDVYYKSCLKFHWGASNPEAKLYVMGKQVPLEWTPHANGTFSWKIANAPAGLATIPLTNNKSYIFIYACWSSGYATWGVMANSKELSQDEVKEIHEYAKKLGFLEKHFMYLRYDTCPDVESATDGAAEKKKAQKKQKGKKQKEVKKNEL